MLNARADRLIMYYVVYKVESYKISSSFVNRI